MEDCVFCKIVAGQIPAKKVYEDSTVLAFLDINPRNPGHTLVVPKKHYETLMQMPEKEAGELFERVKKLAQAALKAVSADGVSISQSNGRAAGQIIPHVHFHVIPRFLNEGPVGLENILPGKKMPEEVLNDTVNKIKQNIGAPQTEPAPREEKQEEIKEIEIEEETVNDKRLDEDMKKLDEANDIDFDF
ncbi:MAG: HIT family protein [Candidatus Aenigmatarchaeota archaeon]|nr:MAG: HIT family protein [Candidatus Aenigmarchaeota archaeon]